MTSMKTGKGMTMMTYSAARIPLPIKVAKVKLAMGWMMKIGDSFKSFLKDSMQEMRTNPWKGTS